MSVYFDNAILKMRSPHQMGVICIDVTNKCDLHCSNCTRLLKNQETFWDMSPENFRVALRSLRGYRGTIAVIGGNPCMHPKFEELCRIIEEEVPNKEQRGLWTNNVFKYHELAGKVFGKFNLNPHGDSRGIESLQRLKKVRPEIDWWGGNSMHSPLLTATKDLFDEQQMWEKISQCDVNQEWSASITENKGKLRVYFCEIAAAFDLANGTDRGHEVTEGWWRKSVTDFSDQVKEFCPQCGVPARLEGNRDNEEIDTYTHSNEHLVEKSRSKKRKVIKITNLNEAKQATRKVVDYTVAHREARKGWLSRLKDIFS